MNCANHARVDAVGVCESCGRGLCAECGVPLRGGIWCRECLERLVSEPAARGPSTGLPPSRLVAALLSLLPGVGHMYLGLIGKGFTLLFTLVAAIFVVVVYSDSTGMYWMTAYLVPTISLLLLAYAVFDAMAIAESMRMGRAQRRDPAMESITERVLVNRRTAGYAVLVAGVIGVLDLFEKVVGGALRSWLGLEVPLTAFIVPVVLVVIGVRLLGRGRGREGR